MNEVSIPSSEWRSRKAKHVERLAAFADERVARRSAGVKHPVDDFLFEYYSFRPSQLLRWSPGVSVLLEGATPSDVDYNEFEKRDGGMILLADSFPDHRVKFLDWAIGYLQSIADRPASFHCFGLHEWAMVYRTSEVRHPMPFRLSHAEIATLVESEGLRCTHFDAFRFFTPSAAPLNRLPLTRQNTDEHDQKGCIHVTMDLYRYAYKIAPWSSGELIADAFSLAWKARQIDMRASPYDLRSLGVEPLAIETRAGQEEYVELQRGLARLAEPLRQRLLEEYRRLHAGKTVATALSIARDESAAKISST